MFLDLGFIQQFADGSLIDFAVQGIRPISECGGDKGAGLHGSAFHAVTAAYATLGYYAHAEVIEFIAGDFQSFAILVYVLAALGGLFSMAMGQPPKNWVWFFIGPALFHFICGTPQATRGVAWMIGPYVQNQSEVWKLAETGAVNSGWARRDGDDVAGWGATGGFDYDIEEGPDGYVQVSYPFAVIDTVVSDTIRQLTSWLGADYHVNSEIAGSNSQADQTNIGLDTANDAVFGRAHPNAETCDGDSRHPAALTNLKWTYLNSVVSASLNSTDARDSLARFMVNECGEALTEAVSFAKFAEAASQGGQALPDTVFKQDDTEIGYGDLKSRLAKRYVPTPKSLRNLFKMAEDREIHNFLHAIGAHPDNQASMPEMAEYIDPLLRGDRVRCDVLLYTVLLYMRYEAANIYIHAFSNPNPTGWWASDITYFMLYGWDIPYDQNGASCGGEGLSAGHQVQFVYNLILAHLIRNEMRRLPELVSVTKDASQQVIDNSQLFNATVGGVSKFAEVYTWSLMMPYVQGLALYGLALAFPFVGILILVPGWHKMFFTWVSFWVWVKLWDVGFAIVSSLEKTLWAMMANSNNSAAINGKVLEMLDYGGFDMTADCRVAEDIPTCINPALILTSGVGGNCGDLGSGSEGFTPLGYDPLDVMATGGVDDQAYTVATVSAESAIDASYRLFDLALILSNSLNLDIANAYYIYIMAALYFAVPAITGQMVLGAKAGAASFVDKIASDPAGKAASGAQTGYQSEQAAMIKQAAASRSQESTMKGHRKSGLLHAALDQQNQSALYGMEAQHLGQVGQGYGRLKAGNATTFDMLGQDFGAGKALVIGAAGIMGNDDDPVTRSSANSRNLANNSQDFGSETSNPPADATPEQTTPGNMTDDGPGIDMQGKEVANQLAAAQDAANNQNAHQDGKQGDKPVMTSEFRGAGYLSNPNRKVQDPGSLGKGARFLGDWAGKLQGAVDKNLGAADWNTAINTLSPVGMAEYQHGRNLRDMEFTAMAGAAEIDAFAANQYSTGLRSASDRTMAAANFAAATTNYEDMDALAQSRSASFSIVAGLPPGAMAPDKRPEDGVGGLMHGMVNTYGVGGSIVRDSKGVGNLFNPENGAFGRNVASRTSGLHSSFGYESTRGGYTRGGPGEALVGVTQKTGVGIRNMAAGKSNQRHATGNHSATQGNQNVPKNPFGNGTT